MKKWIWTVVPVLMLCGCGVEMTLETVADEMIQPAAAAVREIHLELPEEAVLPVMENENGSLYLCKDYDVSVQTLPGGDLQETVREISGCDPDYLTIVQTDRDGMVCNEFVWTAIGELGDRIGRAMILDDGSHHYAVTVEAAAALAEQYREIWNGMFDSFRVS